MMPSFPWIVALFIVRCWCVEEFFTVKLDQSLGYHQCRRKCSQRRGCTDVEYSPEHLSCTLRFNMSAISNLQNLPACGRHYCTVCMIQTRSKKTVSVLDVFYDTLKPNISSAISNETRLTFEPIPGVPRCKQSGKEGNIIEPNYEEHGSFCLLRSVQTFKHDQTYTWLLSVVQNGSSDTPRLKFMCFSIENHYCSSHGSFYMIKRGNYYYRSGKSKKEIVTNSSDARLRLTLHGNVLNVTNLNRNADLTPVILMENNGDLHAEIRLPNMFNCKIFINEGNSQP